MYVSWWNYLKNFSFQSKLFTQKEFSAEFTFFPEKKEIRRNNENLIKHFTVTCTIHIFTEWKQHYTGCLNKHGN